MDSPHPPAGLLTRLSRSSPCLMVGLHGSLCIPLDFKISAGPVLHSFISSSVDLFSPLISRPPSPASKPLPSRASRLPSYWCHGHPPDLHASFSSTTSEKNRSEVGTEGYGDQPVTPMQVQDVLHWSTHPDAAWRQAMGPENNPCPPELSKPSRPDPQPRHPGLKKPLTPNEEKPAGSDDRECGPAQNKRAEHPTQWQE
ncbi:hypothetical protein CRENBAI_021444 [Crenichthys baileyi]|uniref:Uncharacterized protein n=1 Tax=Crenichthys baileyi TaxID=28760 RepID=A0AAV9RQ17_9TELE